MFGFSNAHTWHEVLVFKISNFLINGTLKVFFLKWKWVYGQTDTIYISVSFILKLVRQSGEQDTTRYWLSKW